MRLIDTDALRVWLKTIPLKDLSDGQGLCRVIMEHDFERAIRNMPNACIVDAAPVRHGHWIPRIHEDYDGGYYLYHCSLCDRDRPHKCDNYCPKCGAKMDEHFAEVTKKVDEVSYE